MSGTRTLVELGVVVGGLAAMVFLVIWGAGRAAAALTGFISTDVDRTIGEHAWGALARDRCENPEPLAYVEGLTEPLVQALGPSPFEFRFAVVSDPEVNAFALPGGFITVNMGLLEAAESGEEIAAVLAHEIQHVVERHGTKRILRELGGTMALSALFGGTDIAAPASTVSRLLHTAYDRDQEREADRNGRALLVRAGVDPGGIARFFERLSKSGPSVPELLSTHPDPGNRAAEAKRAAADAKVTRKLPPPTGLSCR